MSADPDLVGLTPEDLDVLWARIDQSGGPSSCWTWLGASTHELGYGIFNPHLGVSKRPYRVTYALAVGTIPEGLVIDHLCRNPRCVNPSHLEPVTHKENLQRSPLTIASINAAKTHCPHGHEYAGENLLTYVTREGRTRQCKACRRARDRKHAARRRAEARAEMNQETA